jgi:hypothetical protein
LQDVHYRLSHFLQSRKHCAEAGETGFEVFDDFFGQSVRLGQVVEIGQTLVFQPENIKARFVACGQFVIGEFTEAPVGIFSASQVALRLCRFLGL